MPVVGSGPILRRAADCPEALMSRQGTNNRRLIGLPTLLVPEDGGGSPDGLA
jgi:hypothetical protein